MDHQEFDLPLDPSCNVIFAATRFGASIFAETDLIPPPFCSPVSGSASKTGKSLLCFIAAARRHNGSAQLSPHATVIPSPTGAIRGQGR